VKDAGGRFQKGDLVAYTVMEKRAGWGTEYADDIRNGEWEYAVFGADGKFYSYNCALHPNMKGAVEVKQ
jgi:plastocyanin